MQSPERDLCFLSATTFAADPGARKVSPVEVVGAVIDHIKRLRPETQRLRHPRPGERPQGRPDEGQEAAPLVYGAFVEVCMTASARNHHRTAR